MWILLTLQNVADGRRTSFPVDESYSSETDRGTDTAFSAETGRHRKRRQRADFTDVSSVGYHNSYNGIVFINLIDVL